ncbi:MAG: cupredoxin domain-containing protein [Planctomycetes bacterium]|nr:cupredoxin domain-containing protein [Planctomycetota bacterium]
MNWKIEIASALLVLLSLVAAPAWVLHVESEAAAAHEASPARVITLTAVAAGGIWTEEEVAGHNYWRRQPEPARTVVLSGENVVIRLKSADVSHSFSIPELEVGPVAVEPGKVSVVRFVAPAPGEYLIQCSTRCGPCHEEMLGTLVVLGSGETLADYPPGLLPPRTKCPNHGSAAHSEGGDR